MRNVLRSLSSPLAFAVMLVPGSAIAQVEGQAGHSPEHAVVVTAGSETWSPVPPMLPAGASLALLEGDPSKAGPFTMRLRMPDGYRIAPHYHHAVEHVSVLSGTLLVGMGEEFDAASLKPLPAGSFGAIPPGMRHFAQAQGETVLQLHGVGPWSLTYVNPEDAPKPADGTP